jgi:hypothetical protein
MQDQENGQLFKIIFDERRRQRYFEIASIDSLFFHLSKDNE